MGGDAVVVENWGYVPVQGGYVYNSGMAMAVNSTGKALVARIIRYRD